MSLTLAEKLARAVERTDSTVCVGLDPRLEALPKDVLPTGCSAASLTSAAKARAFRRFGDAVIDALWDVAAAVKPQIAFYEIHHADGVAAYIENCREARRRGIPVIADIKRGDIGTTATAYAEAWLAPVDGALPVADAVTVNPYMGRDTLDPFLKVGVPHGGGIFVLVKTSNPSSKDYQDRMVDGHPLHEHVATDLAGLVPGEGYGPVGAVVGATHPDGIKRLRHLLARSWMLVPGYGAQGGTAADCALAMDDKGHGAIINASRSLTFPWGADKAAPAEWKSMIREAGIKMRDELRRARDARPR